jgi:hypothetical protein
LRPPAILGKLPVATRVVMEDYDVSPLNSEAAFPLTPAAFSKEGEVMADDNGNGKDPFWYRALKTFGLPTFLLLALLYFGYQGVLWLGHEVLLPLSTRHIQFLEDTTKISKENMEISKQNAISSQQLAGAMVDLKNTSNKQTEILQSIHRKLFAIPSDIVEEQKKEKNP